MQLPHAQNASYTCISYRQLQPRAYLASFSGSSTCEQKLRERVFCTVSNEKLDDGLGTRLEHTHITDCLHVGGAHFEYKADIINFLCDSQEVSQMFTNTTIPQMGWQKDQFSHAVRVKCRNFVPKYTCRLYTSQSILFL